MVRSLSVIPLACLLLCRGPAYAKPPGNHPDPQLHAAAETLRVTMGGDEQLMKLLDVLHGTFVGLLKKNSKLTSEAAAKICDEVLMPAFKAHLGELDESLVDIYARNYTLSELQQLTVFYGTALGKKLLATMPLVFAEGREAGREWGTRVGQEIIAEHRQDLLKRGVTL